MLAKCLMSVNHRICRSWRQTLGFVASSMWEGCTKMCLCMQHLGCDINKNCIVSSIHARLIMSCVYTSKICSHICTLHILDIRKQARHQPQKVGAQCTSHESFLPLGSCTADSHIFATRNYKLTLAIKVQCERLHTSLTYYYS